MLNEIIATANSKEEVEQHFDKLFRGEGLKFYRFTIKYSNNPLEYERAIYEGGFEQSSRWRVARNYFHEALNKSNGVITISCPSEFYREKGLDLTIASILYSFEEKFIYLTMATELEIKFGLLLRWLVIHHLKAEKIFSRTEVKKLEEYYQSIGYIREEGDLFSLNEENQEKLRNKMFQTLKSNIVNLKNEEGLYYEC